MWIGSKKEEGHKEFESKNLDGIGSIRYGFKEFQNEQLKQGRTKCCTNRNKQERMLKCNQEEHDAR